jgi:ABC-2 type transport system ATP-binding protein
MDSRAAIKAQDLRKDFKLRIKRPGLRALLKSWLIPEYSTKTAVSGINLEVQAGEVAAFIGPNGAGKSTTIKMLAGIVRPSSGTISVLGFNPQTQRKALAYKIGLVFGQRSQLFQSLPARACFELLAKSYELERCAYQGRAGFLIEAFEIEDLVDIPARKLSLGERMRVEIAVSLLHGCLALAGLC